MEGGGFNFIWIINKIQTLQKLSRYKKKNPQNCTMCFNKRPTSLNGLMSTIALLILTCQTVSCLHFTLYTTIPHEKLKSKLLDYSYEAEFIQ